MSWSALKDAFGGDLADALRQRLESGESPEIDPAQFAVVHGVQLEQAIKFLDAATATGFIDAIEVLACPVAGCGRFLDEDALANNQCPYCETDYDESGDAPVTVRRYRIDGERSRDIPWVIVVHGFNTLGSWQEEFSWRIANKLKYSAPVFIYKYGLIRFSVLFRLRHRALARQLGNRIKEAIHYAHERGISDPPDVIIHSFGSHLFTVLLGMNEYADIKFGRVIAAGAIVRPDFNWDPLITSGRIDAVLNHCGAKDRPVLFAQFCIPGTGPGGRHGFSDAATFSALNAEYGHSSCFESSALTVNLAHGGLWDRFLKQPAALFTDEKRIPPESVNWRPVPSIVGFLLRTVILALFALLGLLLLASFVVGLMEIVSFVSGTIAAFFAEGENHRLYPISAFVSGLTDSRSHSITLAFAVSSGRSEPLENCSAQLRDSR